MGSVNSTSTPVWRARWQLLGHPARQLTTWLIGSLLVGAAIGGLIQVVLLVTNLGFDPWFFSVSVTFSVCVAVAAFACSRSLMPLLARSHPLIRYGATMMALVGAAILAMLISIGFRWTIVFTEKGPLMLGATVLNLVLALLVGGALITWDGMRRSLLRAYDELRVKEAMEREMTLAREVQEEMLPKHAPPLEGLEFAYTTRPARQVGGDTLDFVPLPDGRWAWAVGDVVGKGMAAALMMANLQALVRGVASVEPDPGRLNEILSDVIGARVRSGRFVTLAYLVYDPGSGQIEYSLAGHHPPLIVGPNGARMLERGGLPLGLYPGLPYEQGTDRLEPGETLVLYTDGLIEAGLAGDETQQFGHHRLKQICSGAHPEPAQAILDRIVAALDDHLAGTPPADDTTVLVIRRLECPS